MRVWEVNVYHGNKVDSRVDLYHFANRELVEESIGKTWANVENKPRRENMADGSIVLTDKDSRVVLQAREITFNIRREFEHF